MNTNEFTQKIYDLFAEILPEKWERFVLHTSIEPGVQSMYFFVRVQGQKKYYSFQELEQQGLFTENQFRMIRLKAGRESFIYQKEFHPAWTGYTLSIDNTGDVNIDFEYDEQSVVITESWKNTYLK